MPGNSNIPQRITALLVYARPPLVFGAMLCALGVMWNRSPLLYTTGVAFLLIAMIFDVIDGWFAARFPPNPTLANLADRVMDKVVYSIIFPLVAVGVMWRLIFIAPGHSRQQVLHAILVLLLSITVLIRDNFAHFIRSYAVQDGVEPETKEFTRLRTMVAAPVGVLLYVHAFYIPNQAEQVNAFLFSGLANLPLRAYFIIEIIFLIINFGSIATLCRKYGAACLNEVCLEDDLLRRRILAFFPNALTVMNAMMGLMAVFFANQGRIREAYLFLLGAAIFDKLDGALARKLGLTEPLPQQAGAGRISVGGILDDIADGISFCLVPALIFYLTLSSSSDPHLLRLPVGLVSLFYFFMGIGRLIYFTLDRSPIPGFFKGMPTPAAALLVVAPLLMFSQAAPESLSLARFWGYFSFGLMVVAALAMNLYPVHYLHIGRYMDSHAWFGRINILLLAIFVFTPYFGYFALVYLLMYLLSPVLSHRLEPEGRATSPSLR